MTTSPILALTEPILPLRIGKYHYYNGAGCRPNRKIEFFRTPNDPKTFQVKVKAMKGGKWYDISTIEADLTTVQMQPSSVQQKALQRKMLMKNDFHPINRSSSNYIPNEKMSELSLFQQNMIIDNLRPKGNWAIGLTTGIGRDPSFEKIEDLHFYENDLKS